MNFTTASRLPWKIILATVAVAINLIFIHNLFSGSNTVYTWHSLKERRSKLVQEVDELNKQCAALSREIRLLKADPAYVEKIIRNRLNYVKKNEILYIFDAGAKNSAWDEGATNGKAK